MRMDNFALRDQCLGSGWHSISGDLDIFGLGFGMLSQTVLMVWLPREQKKIEIAS